MGRKEVVVVGWYGHGNLGDESFIPAFERLFPDWDLYFKDHFPDYAHQSFDGLLLGGGSVLGASLKGLKRFLDTTPASFPIGVIGVDNHYLEANSPYLPLLERSRVNIFRDEFRPDLTFVNTSVAPPEHERVRVLFIPNDFWVAKWDHPKYKSVAWDWASHEMAGYLDELAILQGRVDVVPMGTGIVDDRRAGGAILSLMKRPESVNWDTATPDDALFKLLISTSHLVVSGRYHGCVFAAQQGVPFLAINSHDKFTSLCQYLEIPGASVPYYGFQKASALRQGFAVRSTGEWLHQQSLKARDQWLGSSASVAKALFG